MWALFDVWILKVQSGSPSDFLYKWTFSSKTCSVICVIEMCLLFYFLQLSEKSVFIEIQEIQNILHCM